jgi:outer membrane protein, heavy metal efflux system
MRLHLISIFGLFAGAAAWSQPTEVGPAATAAQAATASLTATANADSLDLNEAIALALENHPALQAQRSAVAAREAAAAQAAMGFNPELAVEVEDLAGTGAYRGVEALQTTVQVSQTLEWGGKRGRRVSVAQSERKLAEAEWSRKRRDVRASVTGNFLEALNAQRRLSLALESKALSLRLLEAVSRRVKEGAASMADEIRARLAVTQAEMEIRQDTVRLESARRKLSLMWGVRDMQGTQGARDGKEGFRSDRPLRPLKEASVGAEESNDAPGARPLPALEDLAQALDSGAATAAWAGSISLAEAHWAQQRSLSGPDITLSGGVRHNADAGDFALVAGIAMPLGIRNRNQGGAAEARHELDKARAERKAAVWELQSRVGDLHRDLRLARDEIETLRESLIPDAAKAAGVLEEGYRRGRFGMPEVLNAESELFRLRLRHLDGLLRYQLDYAELERLMGMGD